MSELKFRVLRRAIERNVQSMDLTWKPPRVILLSGQRSVYHIEKGQRKGQKRRWPRQKIDKRTAKGREEDSQRKRGGRPKQRIEKRMKKKK
jgi:hypothetical protein